MEKGTNVKEAKRKAQLGSCGGGNGNIGGLVLLGGALAVAGLAATFTVHKGNRRRDSNDNSIRRRPRKEEQPTQGLRFVLQASSHSPTFHINPCCASNGSTEMVKAQIDSSTLISTNCSIMEENDPPAINSRDENSNNDDHKILLTDGSKQDSIKLCDNHSKIEEFSLPELNSLSMYESEKMIKNTLAEETSLMDAIEVAEEVAMDAVKMSIEKISSVQSVEEEEEKDNNNDCNEEEKEEETKEVEEKIEVIEEEEPVDAAKICEENTSLHSAEEDDDDGNFRKESPLTEINEVRKEQEAVDDAPQMSSASIKLSENSVEEEEEDDNDGGGGDEGSNEEYGMKKTEENSEGTGSSSAGSDADKIWPAESVEALSQELKNMINLQHYMAKTSEEEQNNKTEECTHLDNSKIGVLNSCRDISQTIQNSTFLKKENSQELIVEDNQPAYLRKWRIWVRHVLVLAFAVLLLFTQACNSWVNYLGSHANQRFSIQEIGSFPMSLASCNP